MINSEKVKSMSDVELSILLTQQCPSGSNKCLSSSFNPLYCCVCWLKWLKQEAK